MCKWSAWAGVELKSKAWLTGLRHKDTVKVHRATRRGVRVVDFTTNEGGEIWCKIKVRQKREKVQDDTKHKNKIDMNTVLPT